MLSFSISYPDLIKLPYFADLTQREGIGGENRPKDRITFKENSTTIYNTCSMPARNQSWTQYQYQEDGMFKSP
jgi:hypothetical protein